MAKNQHSQQNLPITTKRLLLLGTGGTIAGLGGDAYQAAQLPIDALIPNSKHQITCEQIAQIDSKDMSFELWELLYARLCTAMQDESVDAVVITHGTDTMEETAYFLHRTLAATKPVILTGAMRPADDAHADGPGNLADSLEGAVSMASKHECGVWVVFAGQTLRALGVQKTHPTRLDAFQNGFQSRDSSVKLQFANAFKLVLPIQRWPRVEIVMNYAGASGAVVEALILQNVDGIVVAGTGNGTSHTVLEFALDKARKAGIAVSLTTRCLQGRVQQNANHAFDVSPLTPVQARIELMLTLIAKG